MRGKARVCGKQCCYPGEPAWRGAGCSGGNPEAGHSRRALERVGFSTTNSGRLCLSPPPSRPLDPPPSPCHLPTPPPPPRPAPCRLEMGSDRPSPLPIPPCAAPARVHARLSRGAACPRRQGFRTRTGRAACEGGRRRTDLGARKPGFGNGFAVWPWASHSPSLGPTSSPVRKEDQVPSCRGIPEVSITHTPPPNPGGFCSSASTRLNNKRRPSRGRMSLDSPLPSFPARPTRRALLGGPKRRWR